MDGVLVCIIRAIYCTGFIVCVCVWGGLFSGLPVYHRPHYLPVSCSEPDNTAVSYLWALRYVTQCSKLSSHNNRLFLSVCGHTVPFKHLPVHTWSRKKPKTAATLLNVGVKCKIKTHVGTFRLILCTRYKSNNLQKSPPHFLEFCPDIWSGVHVNA